MGRCQGGSSQRKDLPPLMSHRNAPLSFEGQLRLVHRCQQRPISHVAAEMGISRASVDTHLRNMYRKLGATNRGEAVSKGLRAGLLAMSDL